jgi:hypothetical protein
MLQSLVLLLLVSIAGINTVTGAFAGGITFGLFQSARVLRLIPKSVRGNFSFIGAGLGAMGLGRNPNGWTSEFGPLADKVRTTLSRTGGHDDQPSDGTYTGGDGPMQEVKELAGTPS